MRMNKRRLLKLADLLEADAKNKKGVRFDLGTWGQTEKLKQFVQPDCGTVACAVGLACVSGAFKRSGLDFRIDEDTGDIIPTLAVRDGVELYSWDDTLEGYDAGELFFDLEEEEFAFLFNAQSYPKKLSKGADGERYVAKRIRDFVAGKVSPP
jgi:hypothetical protein